MANLFIVRSMFNKEITGGMEKEAIAACKRAGAQIAGIARVPGAFDIPFAASLALARKDVDAVVAIGAIITGETDHDVLIAHAMAHKLEALSCEHGKPVGLGVIGPGATEKQAEARAKEYAYRAVDAAIKLLAEAKRIKGAKK